MSKMYWTVCDCCGKEIQKKLAEKDKYKHKFCSLVCSRKYRKKRIIVHCEECGKAIERTPSEIKAHIFCSRSCKAISHNRQMKDKKHPNFINGIGSYRKIAMDSYGKQCMNPRCELKQAQINIPVKLLDVHHIDENRKNNKIVNLIVLCVWCHMKITRKLATIENMMKGNQMEFNEFKQRFQRNFERLANGQNFLFVTDVNKDDLWTSYLESFKPEDNPVYRKRREFDCSCCKNFIRAFGNVVTIKDNQVVSIWDFDTDNSKFTPVVNVLDSLVKSASVRDVFVTKQKAYGTDKNREQRDDGSVHTWEHFHLGLPKRFVTSSHKTVGSLMAEYKSSKDVFKRSLEELSRYSLETVLDLIAENSLYKGQEWQAVLSQFLDLHDEYHSLDENEKDNYCWSKSTELGGAISRIRNHSIGVLLQDITSGVEVLDAVKRYENIVAPTNYKRPKAIFTKRMVEQAQETITRLGLVDSLGRRYAVLSDITINNVLWANRDAVKPSGQLDVFDVLKSEVSVKPKSYERVQGVDIETFINDILPTATSVEVLLENRHEKNLMSLIAPKVKDSPSLFKWPKNGFSWAYKGNIADSMKQLVKAAGGNVDGDFRFSIQWNTNQFNGNDYDAHSFEPAYGHIYYSHMRSYSGELDVDIINPVRGKPAVENIVYANRSRMPEGIYEFKVHCYSHRGGRSGFDAEIEFDGQIYEFAYHKNLRQNEMVMVAKVQYTRRDGFKIIESLPTTTSTKTVWNLATNQFHPVSTVMFSPNYWDGQGVGNKHYFLMLADCVNDGTPNGFFNEYLKQEFMEHKRVFAALGNKMKVEPSDNQLSGLGFSSTRRDWLIVRVDNKPMKIVF